MILPDNGKVIIIDDEPDDIKNLANALTREKMPFLFYTDRGMADLPSTPINNVRLVFLDFELGLGGTTPIEKIRFIQARLIRILERNHPYVLVIWSQHEEQCLATLKDEFANGFKDFRPVEICSLDKVTIKRLESEGGHDVITHIRDELKRQLAKFESINAFLLWERIVGESCGEIVNSLIKIFEFDNDWDKNIKSLLYKLAAANVGPDKVKELKDDEKLRIALETINSALIDTIEKNIRTSSSALKLEITQQSAISPKNLIAINTKLHILNSDGLNHYQSGNVYYEGLFNDEMVLSLVSGLYEKKVTIDEIMASKPQMVKVDVTPVCDYAQDKGYTRLVLGILLDEKYKDKKLMKTSPAYIYNLCPVMSIEKEPKYMIFDFRIIKSYGKDSIEKYFEQPKYKIRSQLINDIQAQISNHMNRPGIISVN